MGTDDYIAIQRLVHRYSDAVVHRDPDQWGSCWAVDAEWDLGGGRRVMGHDAVVELWKSAMGTMQAVVQTAENGDAWYTAESGEGAAAGRWYITEVFRRTSGEPGILRAHYTDAYVRSTSGWLFANRKLRVHYIGPPDMSAPFLNTAAALSSAV